MRVEFNIQVLTDLCLNSANHTLGDPHTHDYIPGRVLWGAVASRAYQSGRFSEEQAFRLFQQGRVRFFNASPRLGEARAYPMPASWHAPKNVQDQSKILHNFALESVRARHANQQFKAQKNGWISTEGFEIEVPTTYSLRTSIDSSGRAREGLLYGLAAIRAGTQMITAVEGAEEELEQILPLLVDQELRIGRSRNAEFGLIRLTRRKEPALSLRTATGSATRVSVLCVSRCLFRNPSTGAPTLQPAPESLGLPTDWQYLPDSSFVRSISIVHFNAKRKRPETERIAIEQGSVLTFAGSSAVDLAGIQAIAVRGVGDHCAQGYGEVLVNPAWLTEEQFQPKKIQLKKHSAASAQTRPEKPTDELFRWAERRAKDRKMVLELHRLACTKAQELRRYRIPGAQWGVVRTMAREARFLRTPNEKLLEQLQVFLDSGKRRLSGQWKEARSALLSGQSEQISNLATYLELVASASMRPALERTGGKDE